MMVLTGLFECIYNAIRFAFFRQWRELLLISPSAHIAYDTASILSIGSGFRARNNVEVNVRNHGRLKIENNVFLNSGCLLTVRESLTIGEHTIIGSYVQMFDHDHVFNNGHVMENQFKTAPIVIGKNCWIGSGTIILKGSDIGDNCVIAAGSVIKGKIAPFSKVIQKRSEMIITPLLQDDLS